MSSTHISHFEDSDHYRILCEIYLITTQFQLQKGNLERDILGLIETIIQTESERV